MATRGISKEELEKAKERADDKAGFLSHMMVYLIVITGLAVINILQDVDEFWFVWVAVIWGIGVLVHGLGVFVLDGFISDFKDNQLKREIEKIKEDEEDTADSKKKSKSSKSKTKKSK